MLRESFDVLPVTVCLVTEEQSRPFLVFSLIRHSRRHRNEPVRGAVPRQPTHVTAVSEC